MDECIAIVKRHTMGDVLTLFQEVTGCKFFGNVEDHFKPGMQETISKVDEIIAAQATDRKVYHTAAQENVLVPLCKLADDLFLTFRLWLSVQTWDQRRVVT